MYNRSIYVSIIMYNSSIYIYIGTVKYKSFKRFCIISFIIKYFITDSAKNKNTFL